MSWHSKRFVPRAAAAVIAKHAVALEKSKLAAKAASLAAEQPSQHRSSERGSKQYPRSVAAGGGVRSPGIEHDHARC
jgi:hypothetical protein